MSAIVKPVPRANAESRPFWDAAQQKRLVLQQCGLCGQFWFPPAARCRHCLSAHFAWTEVSGEGRVYSFVVYHRLYHPAFEQDLPYVVALVGLREGPRMLGNIIGTSWQDVRCDQPVRVIFPDDSRGFLLPQFTIADG